MADDLITDFSRLDKLAPPKKSLFKSWTVWVNFSVVVCSYAAKFFPTMEDTFKDIPAVLIGSVALINIILRMKTRFGIKDPLK